MTGFKLTEVKKTVSNIEIVLPTNYIIYCKLSDTLLTSKPYFSSAKCLKRDFLNNFTGKKFSQTEIDGIFSSNRSKWSPFMIKILENLLLSSMSYRCYKIKKIKFPHAWPCHYGNEI